MKKRYWLRGGVITTVICVLVVLGSKGEWGVWSPVLIFSTILSYFISGSILGWFYGKIKNKNVKL